MGSSQTQRPTKTGHEQDAHHIVGVNKMPILTLASDSRLCVRGSRRSPHQSQTQSCGLGIQMSLDDHG